MIHPPLDRSRQPGRTIRRAFTLVLAVDIGLASHARAQTCAVNVPHVDGQWTTRPYLMPINPISATLMHDGRVLIVAGSENDGANNTAGAESYRNAVWDPSGTTQGSIVVQNIDYDVFCSGTAALPDGRELVVGGTSDYSFTGDNRASIFDPATSSFVQSESMTDGRWYATATALGDGRIMAFSGTSSTGGTNNKVEIYDLAAAGVGWSSPVTAPFSPPLYPRMALLPNGNVFFTGQGAGTRTTNSWLFNPSTRAWTMSAATDKNRSYGSGVLLPLVPPAYKPKVVYFGGGSPATSTTGIIDLSVTTPTWTAGPSMSTGRTEMNAVLLPSGKVLAEGGSVNNETPDNPGLKADLYDPVANVFKSGGTASYSRLYHSTALLLPDATVASMGSNPGSHGSYQGAIEIYTPAYLFDANDNFVTNRPTILGVAPASGALGYNASFSVTYSSASAISSAVLMRPGSATHAEDMDQRMVVLCGASPAPACTGAGTLTLKTPPNGNVAPPGYWMLFLLDGAGVPSKAQFIQLSLLGTTPPRGAISAPPSDVTIAAGGSVFFASNTTAANYAWVFPGGSPTTSVAKAPGSVTFATPGEYVASLTVVDGSGNTDPSPPTRTITVLPPTPDFELDVTPSSGTVIPGQSATYTVSVTPLGGFTGAVTLSAGSEVGFPSGVTSGGFTPPTITGSGSSTLTMNTTSGASPYAVSVTITGTSGTRTHTASTTLLVNLAAPGGLTATPGPARVALAWPASVGASSYHVKRSLSHGGPYVTLGCPTGTTFTDTTVANGTTYFYVVSAGFTGGPNAGGESPNSSEATATPSGSTTTTTTSPPTTTLPPTTTTTSTAPPATTTTTTLPNAWTSQDVGSVGVPGSATIANGTFTLRASGTDIWGTADAFQYVWVPLTGDGQIVARVTGVQSTDPWAKAGVMIRETLTPGSRQALVAVTSGNGVAFQRRVATGGDSTHTSGPAVAAPYWVRLVRSGSLFFAYSSPDGAAWSLVGVDTIPMASAAFVGLAATSHSNTVLGTDTLDNVSMIPGSSLPASWVQQDIGAVGLVGGGSQVAGTFADVGSGADIWDVADAFHFIYQPLAGDGQITAKIASVGNTDGWAKAGVMIRESLTPGSRQALVAVTNANGVAFQRRTATGGISTHTSGPAVAAPYWVRLVRSGNTLAALSSPDGVVWTQFATDTIAMAANVWVGLAVTSHNNAALCTAMVSNVALTGGVPPPTTTTTSTSTSTTTTLLATTTTTSTTSTTIIPVTTTTSTTSTTLVPVTTTTTSTSTTLLATTTTTSTTLLATTTTSTTTSSSTTTIVTTTTTLTTTTTIVPTWQHADIGTVGLAGNTTIAGSTFTITASGDDIWNAADAFQYAYQPLTGDGQIVARVATLQDTDPWAKAGVMIRETLTAGSAHALVAVTAENGVAFQRRSATGGQSTHTSGPAAAVPYWVRLVRSGSVFVAYASTDGTTWTLVGTDVIPMASTVWVGLALTSHNNGRLCTATLDNVGVVPGSSLPAPWQEQDVGTVGVPGGAAWANGVFTALGSGSDIWDVADHFHFVYQPLAGDGQLIAKVGALQPTDGWAKAGVMVRETLLPGSRQALVAVTASNGVAFQRRTATDGVTTHTSGPSVAAPYWVRVVRTGNTLSAYSSADGLGWTLFATDTIPMATNAYIGLAVTSHNDTVTTTAALSGVSR